MIPVPLLCLWFIEISLFKFIEQCKDNEQMNNQEILDRAVGALNGNLYGEKATVDYDGDFPCLKLMGSFLI